MHEDGPKGLAMMYIHTDINCDPEAVVEEFSRQHPRRLLLVNLPTTVQDDHYAFLKLLLLIFIILFHFCNYNNYNVDKSLIIHLLLLIWNNYTTTFTNAHNLCIQAELNTFWAKTLRFTLKVKKYISWAGNAPRLP